METIQEFISKTREIFKSDDFIPLHAPIFYGNEIKYVNRTISSTMVSSIGEFVDEFESKLADYVKTPGAVAVVNGTAGLQTAMRIVGVKPGDEVITQSLSFVATANAIHLNGASPIFIDVEKTTLSLSSNALKDFLKKHAVVRDKECFNNKTGRRISCCVPMHTFGFIGEIEEIVSICKSYYIKVVEDAAESLGSFSGTRAAGTFGDIGVYSFNGNKIITAGGGGAIVSDNKNYLKQAKHITTTAKRPHLYEYYHDDYGYNFRMPNLNAALALAQIEQIESFVTNKKNLFLEYESRLNNFQLLTPPDSTTRWNFWLISLKLKDKYVRDSFLESTNKNGVMTRPIWNLLHTLPIYRNCFADEMINSTELESIIVNIPSSVRQ